MNVAQIVFNGLVVGSFYALVTMGFVLVYRVSGVFNFAQPAVMLLAALVFVRLETGGTWLAIALALLAALVAGAVASALIQRFVMASVLGRPHFTQMIVTFGVAIAVTDLAQVVFGATTRTVQLPFPRAPIHLPFSVGTNYVDLVIVGVSAVVVALTIWVASSSALGLRIRATSENAPLAAYSGIPVLRLLVITWAIAGALAAVSGVAYAARINVDSGMVGIGLAAFPAAMLGGMDSPGGAVLGALIVGLLQAVAVTLTSTAIAEPIGFVAMLAILLVRPYGLLGLQPVERV